MRMKDIILQTGLTDRAVRLYVDSGLLSPSNEIGYTGRRSLDFSEEDVKTLCAIATLRRADFTIADIKRMQSEPEKIGEIIAEHRKKLSLDIETKKRILQNLYGIDSDMKLTEDGSLLYTDVAELIEKSASEKQVPKEDSGIRPRNQRAIMKRRIPSICAVFVLLVMLVLITPIFIKTAFAFVVLYPGGVFELEYSYNAESANKHFLLFTALFSVLISLSFTFTHIFTGKRSFLLFSIFFTVLFMICVISLPTEIKERIYYFEFLNFRYSPLGNIYGSNMDGFIRLLKYIGAGITAVLSALGFVLNEKE